MQRFESRVILRCPKCGALNSVDVEVAELAFETDRGSEHTSEGQVCIVCPSCEYELEALSYCTSAGCEFTMIEFPDIKLAGDPPIYSPKEDDDFLAGYVPPEKPFEVFAETYDQMMELIRSNTSFLDDPQLINRMAFTQVIASMEAYLSDTLIRQVCGDRHRTLKLLDSDKHVNKERFTLKQVALSPNIVEDEVRKYLRSILYHNLERVRFLYRTVLGIELVRNITDWEALLVAVNHRHDCVHRNGFNADGSQLRIFSREYVDEIARAVSRLVRAIEHDLSYDDLSIPDE